MLTHESTFRSDRIYSFPSTLYECVTYYIRTELYVPVSLNFPDTNAWKCTFLADPKNWTFSLMDLCAYILIYNGDYLYHYYGIFIKTL